MDASVPIDGGRLLEEVLTDMAPLHGELDNLHLSLGRLLEDPKLEKQELETHLRKGRVALARLVLKERHL